jgi:addiction module HigA family antidote
MLDGDWSSDVCSSDLGEILEDMGLSQTQFAKAVHVSSMRISHLINGTRPVTAELALRIGKALGQSPRYWLNLQADYDIKQAQQEAGKDLEEVHQIAA